MPSVPVIISGRLLCDAFLCTLLVLSSLRQPSVISSATAADQSFFVSTSSRTLYYSLGRIRFVNRQLVRRRYTVFRVPRPYVCVCVCIFKHARAHKSRNIASCVCAMSDETGSEGK